MPRNKKPITNESNRVLKMLSYPTIQQAALRFPYGTATELTLRDAGAWHVGFAAIENSPSTPTGGSPELISGKFNLSTKEVVAAIGSKRIVQRLRYSGWIKPLFPSRDALYPSSQILYVQRRMQAGEMPPLLPSDIKQRAKAH